MADVAWQFKELGFILIEKFNDSLVEVILSIDGVEDIEVSEGSLEVYLTKESFRSAYSIIEKLVLELGAKIVEVRLIKKADNLIELSDKDLEEAQVLVSKL